jgi:Raf kinase inhibitor-like YbhB/YbcL family protein
MDRDTTSRGVDSTVVNHVKATIAITSTAFDSDGAIPKQYSCQGEGLSPALAWSKIPEDTRSLALIVEDPDAPSGMFVHWVLFDIPPTVTALTENEPKSETLSNTARQGTNGAGKLGWTPPCPPPGTGHNGEHRYFFRIYALDTLLSLPSSTDRDALLEAMKGHVIGEGTLVGRYKKS